MSKALTPEQIIKKVNEWQNAGFVHSLTCGNDSSHPNLIPVMVGEKVVLKCTKCDYQQNHIPDIVLEADIEKSKASTPEEQGWKLTSEEKPKLGANVEYSDDGITVEGTMDYTDERHCMLAYSSSFGHRFGIGFATDGDNGCDRGLICDEPKYWRYYQ